MVHLRAVKVGIELSDIDTIKKEAKSIGYTIIEKSSVYNIYYNSLYLGDFSSSGEITNDKSGAVYDLLSSVVNDR